MNIDSILNSLNWDKSSLIPTIVQSSNDLKVLMLAYTSKDSLTYTLKSGIAHYFSRSKNRIWKKGEESGNIQNLKEIYIDCDSDCILFVVEQKGVACHMGEYSCFFKKINLENLNIDSSLANNVEIPYNIIDRLYHTLQERKLSKSSNSYTSLLYQKGQNSICKKIIEEAGELTFAMKDNVENDIIYECADVIYHILVGLSYKNISPDKVMNELKRRFGTSGIDEKNSRTKVVK
ncbi:bifunctional phosphoribosyl-AMP cyclohydrolase/phosphoribosyl-ATP diphosphatase HisIE [Helicobacter sp. MIT 14-3879]|uniref:bifunctional phosphoribosyl-AMP cyclohydrolase/phosphoribosyl-ATP diphosphatase HisIE n=1 Tax=Helicobacter sp. MIT 14-3879 TaxID=2040649 RepID=UPI000E1F7972|nr:bifunctional phosphoribosyl-AMP cyclohydrolase/phosphoribosyl-ATP diphosphatase HisIE [Helicobacter sp. MIT 14-3879]RDU65042.1 bifunctional phosphoribosyl-AMP cyclohydrolase/phosphoribosyl-ATP pyrophosphatase [Helicobacter sp. MIT 14-3879]